MPSMLQLTGLVHASSQGRSPSSSSRPGCGPGRRQLGTRHRTPVRLLLGPVSPDSPSHLDLRVAGPGVWPGGAGGRRQLGTRHRTPAWLRLGSASGPAGQASAAVDPQVRRAVSTAAARIGSRLTARWSLDRGNGGPADSWTFQPGRPATRDFHHPEPLTSSKSWIMKVKFLMSQVSSVNRFYRIRHSPISNLYFHHFHECKILNNLNRLSNLHKTIWNV